MVLSIVRADVASGRGYPGGSWCGYRQNLPFKLRAAHFMFFRVETRPSLRNSFIRVSQLFSFFVLFAPSSFRG